LGHLVKLRDAFAGRAEFLFVYVSEAPHASTPLKNASRPMPPEGEGAAGHRRRVRWYEGESGNGLTWLLDGSDEAVEEAYSAWPRRLVVVGVDGRVAYDAGHGVRQIWDMDEIERQIEASLDGDYLH
jgi:hypothetical protein